MNDLALSQDTLLRNTLQKQLGTLSSFANGIHVSQHRNKAKEGKRKKRSNPHNHLSHLPDAPLPSSTAPPIFSSGVTHYNGNNTGGRATRNDLVFNPLLVPEPQRDTLETRVSTVVKELLKLCLEDEKWKLFELLCEHVDTNERSTRYRIMIQAIQIQVEATASTNDIMNVLLSMTPLYVEM